MKILLSLLALFVYSSTCSAFDIMPNFKQGMGPQVPEFDYSIDDETDHIANSATIRVPLPSGSVFTKGTVVKVNNPPFLPYSQTTAPDELYDLQVGGTYFQPLERNKMFGASLTVGSQSDYPFWSLSETTFNATASLLFPGDNPKSNYMVFLNESNNRPFLNYIPIPGFIWFYTPDPEDHLFLGLPFAGYSHRWNHALLDEPLTFSVFYLIPASLKVQFVQDLMPWLKIFTGIDFRQEMYLLRDRPTTTDRLFYDEKRIFLGTTIDFNKSIELDLIGGYAFARSFFEGEKYTDPLDGNADLNACGYVSAALTARF